MYPSTTFGIIITTFLMPALKFKISIMWLKLLFNFHKSN